MKKFRLYDIWQKYITTNVNNLHDIKYISNGSRSEAPTVANGIKPVHWSDQVHIINPRLHVLGHEDQITETLGKMMSLIS